MAECFFSEEVGIYFTSQEEFKLASKLYWATRWKEAHHVATIVRENRIPVKYQETLLKRYEKYLNHKY